jgi:excisionase family DNA binding protein
MLPVSAHSWMRVHLRPENVRAFPERFRVGDICRLLGVTRSTVGYWITAKSLPVHRPVRPGRGNHKHEIYKDEFLSWLRRTGRLMNGDAQVIAEGEVERAE